MVMLNTRTSVNTALILRFLFLLTTMCVAVPSAFTVHAQGEGIGPISYGDTVSGTLNNDNGFDEYQFDARADDLVTISMDSLSDDLDPAIRLYFSSGQKLAYDDDGGADVNALLSEFRIPADGKYTIHALRLQKSQSGDYELRLTLSNPALLPVEPGDGASQAYAVSGFLHDDNDSDDFQFDAQAGELVTIAMDTISGDLDPAIHLTSSTGEELLAIDDDGGADTNALLSAFRVPDDGQYTIRALRVDGGQSGKYELRLTLSNPALQGDDFTYGYTVTGSLDDDNDSDEHQFQAHAGDIVTIAMDTISGELDPALRLYGGSGEKLAYDDDGGTGINALLSVFEIPADGEYTIHTLSVDVGRSGEYELRLSGFRTSLAAAIPDQLTVGGRCTLADAITAANEDRAVGGCSAGNGADTILLSADVTLSAALPIIYSEITIEGGGYAISGDDRFRILDVTASGDVTIKNLTLRNGSVNGFSPICDGEKRDSVAWGGAICNLGKLRIIDSEFTKNVALWRGGAIYSDGDLHVTGSVFRENTADARGGAIRSEGKLTVIDSEFISNSAVEGQGGAISGGNALQVTGNLFNNNKAEFGGAVYYEGYQGSSRDFKVTDSVFSGNFANMYGGAIVAAGGDTVVRDSKFNGNATGGNGGAIVSYDEIIVTSSQFNDNSADEYGGAIVSYDEIIVTSSQFNDNSADEYGGAIAINFGSELKIRSSEFSGNTVGQTGGALHSNGMLDVQISDFTANSAGESGGAVFVGIGSATVQQSTFSENSPEDCSGYVCVHEPSAAGIAESPAQESTMPGVISVGESCELLYAILAANEDRAVGGCPAGDGADTIVLTGDIKLSEELPAITSEITLEGSGHTISGAGRFRIFFVAENGNLTIKEAELSNGTAHAESGAAHCSANIESASAVGGAVCSRGHLQILDSVIVNGQNNAIFIDLGGELSVTGSEFRGNQRAIFISGGQHQVSDSVFNNNLGGGVAVRDGFLRVSDTIFRSNSGRSGGAISISGMLLVIDSVFMENTADPEGFSSHGGAIYINGSLTVKNSHFRDNSAKSGGAIYREGDSTSNVAGSVFDGNSAYFGGAIYSLFGGRLNVTGSDFTFNSASSGGGAIDNVGFLNITNSKFLGNSAGERGGAIESKQGAQTNRLNVGDSEFGANEASEGGAIYQDEDNAFVADSVFYDNSPNDCVGVECVNIRGGGSGESISAEASAGGISVDGSCSLSDAITAANEDQTVGGCSAGDGADTITLTGDITLSAELPPIESMITLEGGGFAIGGDDKFRIFIVSRNGDFTLKDATLRNGSAQQGTQLCERDIGGAICNHGRLSLMTSVFSDNSAQWTGGAIHSTGILLADSSEFSGNSAQRYGGAIYSMGILRADSSEFSGNTAHTEGGAIYSRGILRADSSEFSGNSSVEGSGGAISNYGGLLLVFDSVFIENSADIAGGAIELDGGYAQLAGNMFSDNFPEDCAGVECVNASPAGPISVDESCSLADAITAANEDRAVGGCPAGNENGVDTLVLTGDIRLSEELPAITSEITLEGGGHTISGDDKFRIFLVGESGNMTIQYATLVDGNVREESAAMRCVEDQNASAMWGGAICNLGLLSITGGAIRNSTSQNGGAVYSQNELILTNVQFSGNSAAYGGAIFNWGELNVTNSEFRDNSGSVANAQGGAIYNFEGQLNIVRSNFSSNKAPVGGAIFSDGELSVSNSVFGNNGADGNGGAIASEGEFSVTSSVFEGNTAFRSGGAIVSTGEVSVSDSVFNSNSARGGGAIASGRKLSVTGSEFSGNAATSEGGAIFSFGELGVTDSEFSDNSADNTGGAIFQDGDNAQVADSVFSANSPEDCVGIECASIVSDS